MKLFYLSFRRQLCVAVRRMDKHMGEIKIRKEALLSGLSRETEPIGCVYIYRKRNIIRDWLMELRRVANLKSAG